MLNIFLYSHIIEMLPLHDITLHHAVLHSSLLSSHTNYQARIKLNSFATFKAQMCRML
jgi:hypothetical protein